MKPYLLALIFLATFSCIASPRITVKKEFENVILFYDGNTNNEEYAKLEFIAKRVLLLSKRHNYSQKIILNYLFADKKKEKEFFLSYSKPTYFYRHKNYDKIEEIKLLDDNKDFIMLTSYDEVKSQIEVLQLMDFALADLDSFKKLEVEKIQYDRFEFEYNYVYSISTKIIQKIIDNKINSDNIISALNEKIYRETDNQEYTYFISYFTKNGKYFPYLRERKKETVLDTLPDIKYYVRELNNVFIFKDNFEFNFYAFPDLGEELIVKRDIIYNKDKDFFADNIVIDEILMGVYIIKYGVGSLGIVESSLYTIDKGMIENKLSKYEYHPAIRF